MKNSGRIRRRIRRIILIIFLTGCSGIVLFAILYHRYLYHVNRQEVSEIPSMTSVEDPDCADAIRKGRRFARKLIGDWELPSLSVAVGKNGKALWVESFGYADLEKMIMVQPDMVYRIHSVSKTLTAMSIARLWELDSLDLDTPISEYMPGDPWNKYEITLQQLLCHQSGIRHYVSDGEVFNKNYYPTLDQSLKVFQDDSLLFEPGASFSYSSYGYNLAGAVAEKVARKPFMQFMHETVLGPLGMDHTGIERDRLFGTGIVKYYEMDSTGKRSEAPFIDLSIKYPSGGLESTPEDLVRFGMALMENSFVQDSTFRYFTLPRKTLGGESTGYALGWEASGKVLGWKRLFARIFDLIGWHIPHTVGLSPMIFHSGGSSGGMSALVIYPEQNIVFAFVTNINGELPPVYKMPMMMVEGFFDLP